MSEGHQGRQTYRLRRMEEQRSRIEQAPGAARKGSSKVASSRRARKAHEDRLLKVAVAMGELTMTTDPETGVRYYARTQKDSPVFGVPGEGEPPRPPRSGGRRSARNRRRRWLLRFSFRTRALVLVALGIPLLGLLWHGPRFEMIGSPGIGAPSVWMRP